MPEMRFRIRWPDGISESCYSPSLVIKDYFAAGTDYALTDFLARSRTALGIVLATAAVSSFLLVRRMRDQEQPVDTLEGEIHVEENEAVALAGAGV